MGGELLLVQFDANAWSIVQEQIAVLPRWRERAMQLQLELIVRVLRHV